MEIFASAWWQEGSLSQFLIVLLAGAAVGGLGAWATLRASNPKRQLNWWVQSNTPLMSVPGTSGESELAVTFHGAPLASPRIVELVIANSGRRDITATMFHASQPIRFDFGVPVCTILDATTTPAGSVRPMFDTAGWVVVARDGSGECWVDVAPSLLSRGQEVVMTVLVDGAEKTVECSRYPLVDVKQRPVPLRGRTYANAIGTGLLAGLEVAIPFASIRLSRADRP